MVLTAGRYFLVAVIYGVRLISKHGFHLEVPYWKYLVYASVDTAACYVSILSLKFTTLTSWALIQPAALVVAIPLTAGMLGAKYSWRHLASGTLACLGAVVMTLSDASSDDEDDHSKTALVTGDLLAFWGACLVSLSCVIGELLTRSTVPRCEIITMVASFGFLISLIAAVLIGEVSTNMFPDCQVLLESIAICVSHTIYYIAKFVAFELSGTAAFQISMLGVNTWSILGRITVVGGFHPNPLLFPFALITVISGVVFYALSGDPYAHHKKQQSLLDTES